MKSFIFAGDKLNVHLTLLFIYYVRHCHLPDSVILPEVKNECYDLTDVLKSCHRNDRKYGRSEIRTF